jgi:hypothetical protein
MPLSESVLAGINAVALFAVKFHYRDLKKILFDRHSASFKLLENLRIL